ncbi:hypothetical protein SRHO_G00153720 [Serrasalmus rhombeus]
MIKAILNEHFRRLRSQERTSGLMCVADCQRLAHVQRLRETYLPEFSSNTRHLLQLINLKVSEAAGLKSSEAAVGTTDPAGCCSCCNQTP